MYQHIQFTGEYSLRNS